ncbi:MAG: metal-sensing transcriptional repressor [Candidatus Dojkabacteria bacterium]|nr:metal-sensing transcriptional repressor [Candidatus Dojkabacteria bacterium]
MLLNLKKAKSLIETIMRMVENDKYCIDIMQQNLAVIELIKSAHRYLMEHHIDHYFKEALTHHDTEKINQMIQEIINVTSLYNKQS